MTIKPIEKLASCLLDLRSTLTSLGSLVREDPGVLFLLRRPGCSKNMFPNGLSQWIWRFPEDVSGWQIVWDVKFGGFGKVCAYFAGTKAYMIHGNKFSHRIKTEIKHIEVFEEVVKSHKIGKLYQDVFLKPPPLDDFLHGLGVELEAVHSVRG